MGGSGLMFIVQEAKNPAYSAEDKSGIVLEIKFVGWEKFISFNARSDDSEQHGKLIYREAKQGKYGPVAQYQKADK
jgi:hypothetical protein